MKRKDDLNFRKTTNRSYRSWLKNCIKFYYQRSLGNLFCKRDPMLWAFSAWEGMKYSDNSKYLFQYVMEKAPEIKCIWFTKNKDLFLKLKSQNIPVKLIGTDESDKLQKRVGIAFYTNGLDDFGANPFIYGAKLVCLWHGIGIKKNYYTRKLHSNDLINWLARYKALIFSFIYRDITISSSEYISNIYRMESLTKNPIYVIGQPRNDIFGQNDISACDVFSYDFIDRFKLNNYSAFITYMPTYRGNHEGQLVLENIIKELIDNKDLNDFLQFNKIKFLIKTHYLTDTTTIRSNDNYILIDDHNIECVQKLLKITDILITDYSTCSIDYAMQHKPMIFFTPDMAQYNVDNGLYPEFIKIISDYKSDKINNMIIQLKKIYNGGFDYKMLNRINSLYNTNVDHVGNYCAKIVYTIKQKYCL